jgi:hypothetical protein
MTNDVDAPSRWRYLMAIWFAIVGYFAGGMIGALAAKVVGSMQSCKPAPDLPACNLDTFWAVGSGVGLLLLPSLIVWRMWQSDAARRQSQRG